MSNLDLGSLTSDFCGRKFGPVIVSDISCDYDVHGCGISSLDFDNYVYNGRDDFEKYNVTFTCSNPYILKKIIELVRDYANSEMNDGPINLGNYIPDGTKICF